MSVSAAIHPVQHGSFVIERLYEAPPALVFGAWAEPAAKRQWFHGPSGWTHLEHALDFRVGGREINRGHTADGVLHAYDARYEDIVQDARIVLAFSMSVGEVRISSSLLTVTFQPAGARTRLVLTEQIAVLDPRFPIAGREQGTRELLANLDHHLKAAR
jgi:uncharacterized protein YndB with AHSA1/START domain